MRSQCAWCLADKGDLDGQDDGKISHGICQPCRVRLTPRIQPVDLREFLDRLPAPVLLVRADGRVITANLQACALLGKRRSEVEEVCCGAAIECLNAHGQGGCGRHPRCPGCRLRNAIQDTWRTAATHTDVPVFARRQDPEGAGELRFRSSMEKVGELVVLRLAAA
jgi:PAS domain-containing protein